MSEGIGSLKRSRYEAFDVEWKMSDLLIRNDKVSCRSPVFSFEGDIWRMEMLLDMGAVCNLYLGLVNVSRNQEWREKLHCKLGVKNEDGSLKFLHPCLPKFGPHSITFSEEQLTKENQISMFSSDDVYIICSMRYDKNPAVDPSKSTSGTSLKLISGGASSSSASGSDVISTPSTSAVSTYQNSSPEVAVEVFNQLPKTAEKPAAVDDAPYSNTRKKFKENV